jgi:hypothetical protein
VLLKLKARGAVTYVAGWILVGIGGLAGLAALIEAGLFDGRIRTTWFSGPPLALTYALVLFVSSVAVVGAGVLLIGFGRMERDREEKLLLDPLSYPPFRRPWRRVLPWVAVAVIVMVLPGLWIIPVEHSFEDQFEVTDCAPGGTGVVHNVDLPSGAMLDYRWSSSDGQPIAEVWAPGGPSVSSVWIITDAFFNSTSGYSTVQSHGSPIPFWACDFGSSPGTLANRTVELSGTYYIWLV